MSLKNPYGLNKDAEKPVIKCVYHKDQIVTNFCNSPECMHPLCPVCVAHHIQDHKNYRDYAQFDTYDEILDKTNTEINDFLRTLKLHKDKVENLEGSLRNQETNLKKQLNVAHNKAKVLLDDYFRTLESELSAALNVSKEKFNTDKLKTYEKLQSRAEINVNYALGLYQSDKSVRSLLTYLHNNVKEQNEKFLSQLGDLTDYKTLQVSTDSSKLHEIHVQLSKYVEIKNVPILTDFTQTQDSQINNNFINAGGRNPSFDQSINRDIGFYQQSGQKVINQPQGLPLEMNPIGIPRHSQSQIIAPPSRSYSRVVAPNVPSVIYDVPQHHHLQQQQQQQQQQLLDHHMPSYPQHHPHCQQQQQFQQQPQRFQESQIHLPPHSGQVPVMVSPQRAASYSPFQSQEIRRPLSPVRHRLY